MIFKYTCLVFVFLLQIAMEPFHLFQHNAFDYMYFTVIFHR